MRPVLLLLLLAATDAPLPFRPGLWRLDNIPEAATLDGRTLTDLPYAQPEPETVCLSPAEAAVPGKWLTRDLDAGCEVVEAKFAPGLVRVAASCPAATPGGQAGSALLTGRADAASYDIRFATMIEGENGRMGFSGRMTGRRVGDCAVP